MAHALPHARLQERAGVAIHGRPGQVPPQATLRQQVQHAVQQAPHVGRPQAVAGLGRRYQRLEQPPLVIGQPLARPLIANQRTIVRHPHRRLHDSQTICNATTTRPDQAITPTQATLADPVREIALSSMFIPNVNAW